MENNFLITDDLLWDYADGFLDAPQKAQVDAYLQQHVEWQNRLQLILDEKKTLSSIPLEAPNPGFADRVMAAWAAEQVQAEATAKGKDWIIRLIPMAFMLIVLTPVVIMFIAAMQMAPGSLPLISLPEIKIPAIDWATWANSPILLYGLLLISAIMGLRFLDKILQHQRLAHKLA